MENEKYIIGAYWKEDHRTASAFLTDVFGFMQSVRMFFPGFSKVTLASRTGLEPFPDDFDYFKTHWLPNLYNDGAWYFGPDGIRCDEISLERTSDSGFSIKFFLESADETISIKIFGGQHEAMAPDGQKYGGSIPNSLLMEFPQRNILEGVENYHLLIECIVKHWNPDFASLISREIRAKTMLKEIDFFIGWITFFKNVGVKELLPQYIEPINMQNGILIDLGPHPMKSSNPEEVRQITMLRDSLMPHGFLNWPK